MNVYGIVHLWQKMEERIRSFGLVEGPAKRTWGCGPFCQKPRCNQLRTAVASWAVSWRAGELLGARSMPNGAYLVIPQALGFCWDISAAYGLSTRWPPRLLLSLGVTIYDWRGDDCTCFCSEFYKLYSLFPTVLETDTTNMTCWLLGCVSELLLWCQCG